jgi:hypothetical protein
VSVNNTATAAHELKLAMWNATKDLFDASVVNASFGHPGDRRDLLDIVAWTDVRTEQEPGPLSSNRRSRDEYVYLTVMISCFRAGEADDDLVPSAAAYDILRTIEEHVRAVDPTLGGRCYWCFCDSSTSGGVTDKALLARGRLIQIEAEFKARVRITT